VRRVLRATGLVLAVCGSLMLVWALVVWRWQDPVTLLLNKRSQAQLSSAYDARVEYEERVHVRVRRTVEAPSQAALAAAYRKRTHVGDPIGRLTVPRMELSVMVAFGTDTETLKKGPGLDPLTGLPGQKHLTYVAGHRTTYGAPFSDIDDLRPGDRITFEVPYGTYRYVVVGHRIVRGDQIEVLRGRGREELALQACWPRFFASHRYIAYARLAAVEPARLN
jgi:sortase A